VLKNGLNGIYLSQQNNVFSIRDTRCYNNGKTWDNSSLGNILLFGGSGTENLGVVLDNVDVSYAGGASFTRAAGTLTSIAVSSGTATVTTASAHGLSTGNQVTIYGCTSSPALNTVAYPYTITVTGSTTFTFSTGAANGTYTDSTMGVYPPVCGLYAGYTQGLAINNFYSEECGWHAAFLTGTVSGCTVMSGYVQGTTMGGRFYVSDSRNVFMRGVYFNGTYAGTTSDMTINRHGVDLSGNTYGSNAIETITTIFMRGGVYFSNTSPTAGTWKQSDIVKNSVPSVGAPKGWVCTVAGTPGTWVSEGNL
jgi:hypothetical protein